MDEHIPHVARRDLAFRGKAVTLCPLTTDYAFFSQILDSTGVDSAPAGETDLGMALDRAVEAFDSLEGSHRAIVLVSDGEDLAGRTREAAQRVRAALDKVGLASREKALPVMLSGGEQQRLAIARAVVSRPNLLLADEPTAHLDADTAADVARIFTEFNHVGVTVLIATYAGDLFPGARRLQLDHGRLLP